MLLSTPGSKRWMSRVMADDENSNFVANDAEQEVIREPRNSLSGYHAPGLKKIFWLVCGLGHEITKLGVKLLLRALESQRARSNHYPLSIIHYLLNVRIDLRIFG